MREITAPDCCAQERVISTLLEHFENKKMRLEANLADVNAAIDGLKSNLFGQRSAQPDRQGDFKVSNHQPKTDMTKRHTQTIGDARSTSSAIPEIAPGFPVG